MEINQIIQSTINLLIENKEWEERFDGYIQNIAINHSKIAKRSFRKPEGLSLYSSVGSKGKSYDLRFRGQSVARVVEANGKVELCPRSAANDAYFGIELDKKVDWNSTKASNFRSSFKKESLNFTSEMTTADRKYPKSEEHRVENCLLREFNKKVGIEKALCNIQPIKLYGLFFQMPTPLKASTHHPEYQRKGGGGVDILARVKPVKGNSRICVMEVKDENKPSESQAIAMSQAVTYAVFIAYLLRSNSGQHWWDFFMGRTLTAQKKNGTIHISVIKKIPKHLDIDVVTIMPNGATEEYYDVEIPLEGLDITLHCHSLYYDGDTFQKNETFRFSGTYPNQLRK